MNSGAFKIFLVLHLISVVAAFGPMFVIPVLSRAGASANTAGAKLMVRLSAPALVAVIVFGLAAVGSSDKAFKMSQSWVSIGLLLAIIAIAIVLGVLMPAQRKLATAEESDDRTGVAAWRARVAGGTGAMHLLAILAIIDMVWKPGY